MRARSTLLAAGFWAVWLGVSVVINATTTLSDFARNDVPVDTWEPWVWEASSAVAIGLLIPAVAWLDCRVRFRADRWRLPLLVHALATLPFSLTHVGGMVAIRKLAYGLADRHYDFGNLPVELFYEYRKDAATYVFVLAVFYAWRRILAGTEARRRPEAPAGGSRSRETPEFFVSRKFGREFVVKVEDVDWVEAAGNYVNLHCAGDVFPVRGSMTGMERSLDARRFVRVHRSTIVNVGRIDAITPLESGDYRIRLKDEVELRMSRRYRPRLRELFG